ncbi:MAG: GAF domain-containing protein [Deltaproteobacteria bacterium]|nr:GAF domain-containing protein [Deltaproteobacteria bacterium]
MSKGQDYFKALYEALESIVGSLDHEDVMKNVVEAAAKAVGVKACSLRLLDRRKRKLILGSSTGLSDGYIRKGPVLLEESHLDKEALEGKTIYIENAQKDSRWQYPDKAKQEGIVSVLVAPLIAKGDVIGVLRIYSDEVRSFDDDEMRFLEAMAHLSAMALENARLHKALMSDYEMLVADRYRIDE